MHGLCCAVGCFMSCCLLISCLYLSCRVLKCHVLSSCLFYLLVLHLPCLALPCLALPCLVLTFLASPRLGFFLSCVALVLCCAVVSRVVLPCGCLVIVLKLIGLWLRCLMVVLRSCCGMLSCVLLCCVMFAVLCGHVVVDRPGNMLSYLILCCESILSLPMPQFVLLHVYLCVQTVHVPCTVFPS